MGMAQARIARLTETDWRAFAGVRLRALTDSLGAEDPQYRLESTFTAAQWRRRLRAHAQFAAVVDNRPVGLIGAQRQSTESVYLYSLWLDPAARGHGLGRTLVAEAVNWARAQRVTPGDVAGPCGERDRTGGLRKPGIHPDGSGDRRGRRGHDDADGELISGR